MLSRYHQKHFFVLPTLLVTFLLTHDLSISEILAMALRLKHKARGACFGRVSVCLLFVSLKNYR